jgi:AcrR family transcriptional regulator
MNIAKLARMAEPVKGRRYDASGRRENAERTRIAILTASRELFAARGYAGTTVADIASTAGVAPDTVYAAVGRKPAIFRLLIETALSGTDQVIEGAERDYVRKMHDAPDVATALHIYAEAVTAIQIRLAPLFIALRSAAAATPELNSLWTEISARRAANMRHLVADLAFKGGLRSDLSQPDIADVIWTMNSAEYFDMLTVARGWSVEHFAQWLADSWIRLFVDESESADSPVRDQLR